MSTRREQTLMLVICAMWDWIRRPNGETPDELFDRIKEGGAGWALPDWWEYLVDDDMMTVDQVSRELGMTTSAVRNWQSRYGMTPDRMGRYRWGDVKEIRKQQNLRNTPRAG